MIVVGCLSWYDESPAWLAAAIGSAAKIVDHIVAVDGAYFMFPRGRAHSAVEQTNSITEICHALGLGLTLHLPREVWYGNEIEKRGFVFKLAEQTTEPTDWYYVIDADEVVREVPEDLRERLEITNLDAVEVTMWERESEVENNPRAADAARKFSWDPDSRTPFRKFFRAARGLRPVGNHYTYIDGEGRALWNVVDARDRVPALYVPEFVIEHRSRRRSAWRREQSKTYYDRRDSADAEKAPCVICRSEMGVRGFYLNWRRDRTGAPLADRMTICESDACEAKATELALEQCAAIDLDPRADKRIAMMGDKV